MTMRRLNQRRGQQGGNYESMGWWKCLIVGILITLIGMLIRLNYQLAQALRRDDVSAADDGAALGGGAEASGNKSDEQERLSSLRREVSTIKKKMDSMKDMVNQLKKDAPAADTASSAVDSDSNLSHTSYDLSGKILDNGALERITCTPTMARKQMDRMNKRFSEWWSHSACPDQVWMEEIDKVFDMAMREERLV